MTEPHIALLESASTRILYPIYVPSYSRAGTAPLLELLKDAPSKVKNKVHIVVRPEEARLYRTTYPWATIVKQGKPFGIGPARARCILDARQRGYERILMMDDDIRAVSLLERGDNGRGGQHTRRHSARVAGRPKASHVSRTLAVACEMADGVFFKRPKAAYGAARNALFSGDVDTAVGARLNCGSFPACVMFIDVNSIMWDKCPREYQWHGEDLSMCLDTMTNGMEWFTLPAVAYDQHGEIETTIPLDPQDAVARTPDLENAEHVYPDMFPYLRASYKNAAGGVMRIGFRWPAWYKDTDSTAVEIALTDII